MSKKQTAFSLVVFAVLFVCAPACAPATESTVTITARPTNTPTPAATTSPTPTPTATVEPTSTPTPTPYPTLEPEASLEFILEMLETNGGCELPCWWGVVPGETGWEEMRERFLSQGIGVGQGGGLELSYRDPETGHRVDVLDVQFHQEMGRVQGARIRADYFYLLAQGSFAYAWQPYTLGQILSRYGAPSQVYLDLMTYAGDWTPRWSQDYDLWIVYDDLGMVIRYPGQLIRDNQGWLVCFAFGSVGGIEIKIQSPDAQDPLVEFEGPSYELGGTLAQLTGMSLGEFHDLFSQSPPQSCLLVPDPSAWWYDELVLPSNTTVLSPSQEDELVVSMLDTNAGCELPCWWGITPGLTSWQDARQLFLSYGKSVSNRETDLGMGHTASLFGRHSPYPYDYVIEHQLYERDGTVFLLGIKGYSLGWSPPQHFAQDWQRYSLDQVLARFGTPSEVLLHYWSFGWFYTIGVAYDDLGILIEYTGSMPGEWAEFAQGPVSICPTQNRPTEISIWLTDPSAGFQIADAFARFGYTYPDPHPFYSTPSPQEATGMSLETFYETYLNPDSQVCLEAPRELGDNVP